MLTALAFGAAFLLNAVFMVSGFMAFGGGSKVRRAATLLCKYFWNDFGFRLYWFTGSYKESFAVQPTVNLHLGQQQRIAQH